MSGPFQLLRSVAVANNEGNDAANDETFEENYVKSNFLMVECSQLREIEMLELSLMLSHPMGCDA